MREAHILLGVSADGTAILVGNATYHVRGVPKSHAAFGNHGSLRHKRTCPHNAVASDLGTIEDNSSHANERIVANRTTMNDGTVAYGHTVSYHDGKTSCSMKHSTVLHVRVSANNDGRHVTAQYGVVPHAALRAKLHISDHNGTLCHVCGLI